MFFRNLDGVSRTQIRKACESAVIVTIFSTASPQLRFGRATRGCRPANLDRDIVDSSTRSLRGSSWFRLPTMARAARFRGFTLVELMVVLVILAMLSGVVTLSIRGYLLKSKQNVAKVEISKMMQALDTFYSNFDRYPTNEEGLAILAARTEDFPEGILSFVPKDPWKHTYEYRSPGAVEPYEIVCFGADHRDGGEGGDRDITSMSIGRGAKAQ